MGVDCDIGKSRLQMRSAGEERFLTFVRNDGRGEEEERFLSAQADAFAGANAEEQNRPAPFEMTVGRGGLGRGGRGGKRRPPRVGMTLGRGRSRRRDTETHNAAGV